MIDSKKKDKRVFERFTARFPVKFKHSDDDFGKDIFLRDASAEGLRIATTHRMFVNDCISLTVQLPDGFSPLVLSGRVVWTLSKTPTLWDVGLKFHRTQLMEMRRIYKLVTPLS